MRTVFLLANPIFNHWGAYPPSYDWQPNTIAESSLVWHDLLILPWAMDTIRQMTNKPVTTAEHWTVYSATTNYPSWPLHHCHSLSPIVNPTDNRIEANQDSFFQRLGINLPNWERKEEKNLRTIGIKRLPWDRFPFFAVSWRKANSPRFLISGVYLFDDKGNKIGQKIILLS